jgi:uncharacterized heparinase superfamily protein
MARPLRGLKQMSDVQTPTLKFKGIRPLSVLENGAQFLKLNNPFEKMGFHLGAKTLSGLTFVPPDPWLGDVTRGRAIMQGALTFAGQRIMPEHASWEPKGVSEAFLAELHGFQWLRDLRSVGGDRARHAARDAIANWLDHYKNPHPLFWRADVLGARLAAWLTFHDFFCVSADDHFKNEFYPSLLKQARFLAKNLNKLDLKSLSYVRAVKGLMLSGMCLEGGEARFVEAVDALEDALHKQVLADGVHISRSPEQTLECLQILVDLRAALHADKYDIPPFIQYAIDRLAPAIRFFRHGDGALSLFHGASEHEANTIDAILTLSGARGRPLKAMPHGGFARLHQSRVTILADIQNNADGQDMAHHASPGAFELSIGRDRMIVNCGDCRYSEAWHHALRSTPAHSTLTLDHTNAFERVADDNQKTYKVFADQQKYVMQHDGYRAAYGLSHKRSLEIQDMGEKIIGCDRLIPIQDKTKGHVPFAIRFHLHPSCQVSLIRLGEEALIRTKSGIGYRLKAKHATLTIEESVYWGEKIGPRRSMQVVLNGLSKEDGDTVVEWEFLREKM